MEHKDWYSIRHVAQLTGLSTQLIRKWEERYHAVRPRRLENRYRVYSMSDVMRLRQLQKLVEEGYSIRNAVLLIEQHSVDSDGVLTDQTALSLQEDVSPYSIKQTEATLYLEQLFALGEQGEGRAIQNLLQKVYSQYGLKYLSGNLLIPFLFEIGERWESHVWNEYQEHISSIAVRDFLIKAYTSLHVPLDAPLLLATCIPSERHEIMLYLALLEAAIKGYKTVFLGASPAPRALEEAVIHLRPKVVLLSLTTMLPLENNPLVLDEIDQLASRHPDIQFYIGGKAAKLSLSTSAKRWIHFVDSIPLLFQQLDSGYWVVCD